MDSTYAQGKRDEIVGKARQNIGKQEGDLKLQAEGGALQMKGITEQKMATTKDAASEQYALTKDVVSDKVTTAKDVVSDKVATAKDVVVEKVITAKDVVSEKVATAKDVVVEKVSQVSAKVGETLGDVKEKVIETGKKLQERVYTPYQYEMTFVDAKTVERLEVILKQIRANQFPILRHVDTVDKSVLVIPKDFKLRRLDRKPYLNEIQSGYKLRKLIKTNDRSSPRIDRSLKIKKYSIQPLLQEIRTGITLRHVEAGSGVPSTGALGEKLANKWEEWKGWTKNVVGTVIGNEKLVEEGRNQEERARLAQGSEVSGM